MGAQEGLLYGCLEALQSTTVLYDSEETVRLRTTTEISGQEKK
jgi:hypothetical protein